MLENWFGTTTGSLTLCSDEVVALLFIIKQIVDDIALLEAGVYAVGV